MLKNITITDEELRILFAESDEAEVFEDFSPDDIDGFDWALQAISTVLYEWLATNPVNRDLAGNRTIVGTDMTYPPMESLDLCFIASVEGTIEGYLWTYDLWGKRHVSIATQYRAYKDMRPSEDTEGIDSCVEVAQYILALTNAVIDDTNEFFGGSR